jgi:hypothetical protein
MTTDLKMPSGPAKTTGLATEDLRLTGAEASQLLGICIELIDLCAKVTGKIDPAVAAIVGYARDEAFPEAPHIGS